jgi:two-component system response regulator
MGDIRILLVEDSIADARLIQEVFTEEKIALNIDVVRDGNQALARLRKQGEFWDYVCPDLILLDLNLPKKDGREVLAEIKADNTLKAIPVVVLTTSASEEDVLKSYKLQASCFVTKPIDLEAFVKMIRSLDEFWFSAVRFPPRAC